MTVTQAEQIRKLVDEQGWNAVRSHAVFGPLWASELRKSREFVDAVIDREPVTGANT